MASPPRVPHLMEVRTVRRLSPGMIRVTLAVPEGLVLPAGAAGGHCKLFLPEPGEDRDAFARRLVEGPRPVTRTYTLRHVRPERRETDVDFVDHGDAGPASAWARGAKPGDVMGFSGPGKPKIEAFDADWYLVAADMSALPLAAATLEAMPRDARGVALLEITSEADRQAIDAPPGVELRWLVHPDPPEPSAAQERAVRAIPWPEGRVRTCIAGETGTIRALRHLVRAERGVARGDAYVSGYWKIGLTEDGHQTMKREEAEEAERMLAGGA